MKNNSIKFLRSGLSMRMIESDKDGQWFTWDHSPQYQVINMRRQCRPLRQSSVACPVPSQYKRNKKTIEI